MGGLPYLINPPGNEAVISELESRAGRKCGSNQVPNILEDVPAPPPPPSTLSTLSTLSSLSSMAQTTPASESYRVALSPLLRPVVTLEESIMAPREKRIATASRERERERETRLTLTLPPILAKLTDSIEEVLLPGCGLGRRIEKWEEVARDFGDESSE